MFVLADLRPVWKLSFFFFFLLIVRISWEFSAIFNVFKNCFFLLALVVGPALPLNCLTQESQLRILILAVSEKSGERHVQRAQNCWFFRCLFIRNSSNGVADLQGKNVPGEQRVSCHHSNLTGTKIFWRTSKKWHLWKPGYVTGSDNCRQNTYIELSSESTTFCNIFISLR